MADSSAEIARIRSRDAVHDARTKWRELRAATTELMSLYHTLESAGHAAAADMVAVRHDSLIYEEESAFQVFLNVRTSEMGPVGMVLP